MTGKISSLFQIILSFEEINVSFIFSVTGGIEDVNGKHIIKNHKIVSENIIYRSKLTELEKEAKEYSESFSNENPYKCSYILNTLTNKIIGF